MTLKMELRLTPNRNIQRAPQMCSITAFKQENNQSYEKRNTLLFKTDAKKMQQIKRLNRHQP